MDDRQAVKGSPIVTRKRFYSKLEITPGTVALEPHITKLLVERSEILFGLAKQREGCYEAILSIEPRLREASLVLRFRQPGWPDKLTAVASVMHGLLYDSPLESWSAYCNVMLKSIDAQAKLKLAQAAESASVEAI